MNVKIPKVVEIVELETAPFRNAHEAKLWACAHGIPGKMSEEDTRGKGEISISLSSLEKMLSGQALRKSVTPDQPTKAYTYEISNIEVLTGTARIAILPNVKASTNPRVLKGNAEPVTLRPSDRASMDVGILLNGVCDVNGAPLIRERELSANFAEK